MRRCSASLAATDATVHGRNKRKKLGLVSYSGVSSYRNRMKDISWLVKDKKGAKVTQEPGEVSAEVRDMLRAYLWRLRKDPPRALGAVRGDSLGFSFRSLSASLYSAGSSSERGAFDILGKRPKRSTSCRMRASQAGNSPYSER